MQISISNILLNLPQHEGLKETEELLQKHGQTIFTDDGKCKGITKVLSMLFEIWNSEEDDEHVFDIK